jgi:hypothetical protein
MAALTVELPVYVDYVAGTINGAVKVFEQDQGEPRKWHADVEAAEDSLYHISLEMHDEAGNIGHYEDTIEYVIPWFVYDRTQKDVDRVAALHRKGWKRLTVDEREEWMSGMMKGALNRSDLRRIENSIYVIAQMTGISLATNRDNLPCIPDDAYFQRMLDNVGALRKTGYIYRETPQVPRQPVNTYQKVNAVERILHDVYMVYLDNCADAYYCGQELYADGSGLI